jgi:hypothetical protein
MTNVATLMIGQQLKSGWTIRALKPTLSTATDFRRRVGSYRKSSDEVDGGPCRDRTYDQLIKSQLLYQLS